MQEINKRIVLSWQESIEILKEIEFILCSLHDIGSYYCDKSTREYERETTKFIDESQVTSRLANVRAVLVKKFHLEIGDDDMDDIEREMLNIPYWKQPGDNYAGNL